MFKNYNFSGSSFLKIRDTVRIFKTEKIQSPVDNLETFYINTQSFFAKIGDSVRKFIR